MNLNKNFNNIQCYSFNKQDLIILLSVYNAVYLLSSSIVKSHFIVCFVIAVLLSLVTLFIIAWVDLIKKRKEDEAKSEHEQELVRGKIRDEYQKVHKKKIRNELLMKAGCSSVEQALVVDYNDPPIPLNKDLEEVKEVHFNYLKDAASSETINGQPEGT